MKNALLPRIHALAKRALAAHEAMLKFDSPIDWNKLNKDESEMTEELIAIDKAAGPGLAIGRRLSFSVGDGSADYLITKVCKNHVVVEWIPLCDCYSSPAVGLSRNSTQYIVLRSTAEQLCRAGAIFA